MKTLLRTLTIALSVALAAPSIGSAADGPAAAPSETLETPEGGRTQGRLEGDSGAGFRFAPAGQGAVIPLTPGVVIRFPGLGPAPASGLPPFRLDLGLGQRLSGRLVEVNGRDVRLTDVGGEGQWAVSRAGVDAVVQRPGESLVFQDGFETLDTRRWTVVGEPDVVDEPKVAGAHSLRVAAGGASLTHRLAEPFGSGRLEVAFHDVGAAVTGAQWFVDLTFRGVNGPETVRVVLGWAEDSLAVESPGGPALAVQRLARKPGWHRLNVRFGPEIGEIAVDGNELAHGKGFSGPLTEIRLASAASGKAEPPKSAVGHFDDLRLVKFAEPVGTLETDVTQDEVRLARGDQVFGKVRSADGENVVMTVDGKDATLSWGDASGIYFRRDAGPGEPVRGVLVRAEWRGAPGTDTRDLNVVEGALAGLTPTHVTLATPYAGSLVVPRSRFTTLTVLGLGTRLVLDPKAHHLGDEVSTAAPILDPPQPEGGVLERSFDLAEPPTGPAVLVLDVVQVVGEAPDLQFSALVKKGELRTNLKLNGEPFDYLNRFINSRNETPERIRIPIPKALLRTGKNVIRLEQTGVANDPNFLDDLGILGVAVEFPTEPGAAGGR